MRQSWWNINARRRRRGKLKPIQKNGILNPVGKPSFFGSHEKSPDAAGQVDDGDTKSELGAAFSVRIGSSFVELTLLAIDTYCCTPRRKRLVWPSYRSSVQVYTFDFVGSEPHFCWFRGGLFMAGAR